MEEKKDHDGRWQAGQSLHLPSAPTFYPTEEEFAMGPLHYIRSIRLEAERFGICKIVPPPSFQPPCTIPFSSSSNSNFNSSDCGNENRDGVKNENNNGEKEKEEEEEENNIGLGDFVFHSRVQSVNELQTREGTRPDPLAFEATLLDFCRKQGKKPPRWPVLHGRDVDMSKLYEVVQSKGGYYGVTEKKKWAEVRRHIEPPDAFDKHDSTAVKMLYNRWLLDFERAGGPGDRIKDVFDESATAKERLYSLTKAAQIKLGQGALTDASLDSGCQRSRFRSYDREDESDDENGDKEGIFRLSLSVEASAEMRRRSNYQRAKDKYDMRRLADTLVRVGQMLENGEETDAEETKGGEGEKKRKRDDNIGWELELDGSDSIDAEAEEDEFRSIIESKWDSDDDMADKVCEVCCCGGHEDEMILCDRCDRGFHMYCLTPVLKDVPEGDWFCRECHFAGKEAFGFEDGKEYSLHQFRIMSRRFKERIFGVQDLSEIDNLDSEMLEATFWKAVHSPDVPCRVGYGADLFTSDYGSGFPRTDNRLCDSEYATSEWNINNWPRLPGSVLKYVDDNIPGVMIPWLYVGMTFSSFCWHFEDHCFYSVNYMHWGEPKIWYGVPSAFSNQFEKVVRQQVPHLFKSQPDLLSHIVTLVNPVVLQESGIPVFRLKQNPREFVITFPKAYHGGFNEGFNCAEAVNFAPPDWIPFGAYAVERFRFFRRAPVLSHDEIILSCAADPDLTPEVALWVIEELKALVATEGLMRKKVYGEGTKKACPMPMDDFKDGNEKECLICHCLLHLSSVCCACRPKDRCCLEHSLMLCDCKPSARVMYSSYSLAYLESLLKNVKEKIAQLPPSSSSSVTVTENTSGSDSPLPLHRTPVHLSNHEKEIVVMGNKERMSRGKKWLHQVETFFSAIDSAMSTNHNSSSNAITNGSSSDEESNAEIAHISTLICKLSALETQSFEFLWDDTQGMGFGRTAATISDALDWLAAVQELLYQSTKATTVKSKKKRMPNKRLQWIVKTGNEENFWRMIPSRIKHTTTSLAAKANAMSASFATLLNAITNPSLNSLSSSSSSFKPLARLLQQCKSSVYKLSEEEEAAERLISGGGKWMAFVKRLLSIRDTEGFPPKISSYMINALLEESRRLCFRDDSLVRHLKDLQRQTHKIECDIDAMLTPPRKKDRENITAEANVRQAWLYIVDNILDFPVSSSKISAFQHSVAKARAWSYRYKQHAILIANSKKSKKRKKRKKKKKKDRESKEGRGGRQYHHNRNRNHHCYDSDDDDDNGYVLPSIEPLESLLVEGKQLSFSLPEVEKLEHDIRCLKWKRELEIYLRDSARMKKSEWPTLGRFEELLREGQALGMTTTDSNDSDDTNTEEPLCDLLQSLIETCLRWEAKAQSALRSRAALEDYLTLQKDSLTIYAELPSRETINEVVRQAKEWHQEALNAAKGRQLSTRGKSGGGGSGGKIAREKAEHGGNSSGNGGGSSNSNPTVNQLKDLIERAKVLPVSFKEMAILESKLEAAQIFLEDFERVSSESILCPSKHSLVKDELDILLTARKVLKSSGDSLALKLPELDRLQLEIEAIEWGSYVSSLLHHLSLCSSSPPRPHSASTTNVPLTLSGLDQLISAGQQFSSSPDLKWRSYDDGNDNARVEEEEASPCSGALQSLVELRSAAESMSSELEKIINPEPLPLSPYPPSHCYTLDEIQKVLDRAAGLPVQLEGMTQVRAKLGNLKRTQDKVRNMIKLGKDLLASPPATSEAADQKGDEYLFDSVFQRVSGMPTLNEFEDALSRLQAYQIAVPEIDAVLGVIQSTRAWQASLQHQLTVFHKKNENKTGKQVLEGLLGKVRRAHEICRKALEKSEDGNGRRGEDWVVAATSNKQGTSFMDAPKSQTGKGSHNPKHTVAPSEDALAAHRHHHHHHRRLTIPIVNKRLKTADHHSMIAKTYDASADADADADENINTLYCICRRTASEGPSEMIGCDSCGDWYHTRCIGATSKMTMTSKTYKCPFCAVLGGQPMFSLSENTYNRIYTTKKAVSIDDLKRALIETGGLSCKVDEIDLIHELIVLGSEMESIFERLLSSTRSGRIRATASATSPLKSGGASSSSSIWSKLIPIKEMMALEITATKCAEVATIIRVAGWRARAMQLLSSPAPVSLSKVSRLRKEGESIDLDSNEKSMPPFSDLVNLERQANAWLSKMKAMLAADESEWIHLDALLAEADSIPLIQFTKEKEALQEKCRLYCTCRKGYNEDRPMIACDVCDEWYHFECVGLPLPLDDNASTDADADANAIASHDERWECPRCSTAASVLPQAQPNHHNNSSLKYQESSSENKAKTSDGDGDGDGGIIFLAKSQPFSSTNHDTQQPPNCNGTLLRLHNETSLQPSPSTPAEGAQVLSDSRPSMNGNGPISPMPLQSAAPRKPLGLILSRKRPSNSNSPNSNNSNSSNNSTEIAAVGAREKEHKQRRRSSRGSAQDQ